MNSGAVTYAMTSKGFVEFCTKLNLLSKTEALTIKLAHLLFAYSQAGG